MVGKLATSYLLSSTVLSNNYCALRNQWMHRSAEPSPLHCMHDSCTCRSIACLNVYMPAQYQEYWTSYIPCTWTGFRYSGPSLLSSESVHDKGLGGRHLAMSPYTINWKPLWLPWVLKLDYALESHCLFTLSLHWQLTSKAHACYHAEWQSVMSLR